MKKLLLIFLLLTSTCFAEEVYVFIEKNPPVNDDDGQSRIGEVIAISKTKPNANELRNSRVIIMDLTKDEIITLLMINDEGKKIVKIDIEKIKEIVDEGKINAQKKQSIMDSLLNRDAVVVNP